ncbi:MAG TPA: ABC transporter substrate-binding protein [Chloroflexota bacterium]|nr:ABC transporter substrate-binding protein [Chloroflexota bacterium]
MRIVCRRHLAISLLALAGLAVGSFGVGRNALASSPSHHARAMTTVHFYLNWLSNVEFAGLWVAQHYGWWKKAGINMTYTQWSQSVVPETDVPQHPGNQFGFQSGAALAIARAQGVKDVALYTDTQKSVFGLTVLNKSHITSLKQLKGKKIGYQPHEIYVPETMLASVGLQPQRDYKLVPVSFDISQLTSGAVDAYETFLTNEPITLDMQGVKNHSFAAADYGFHFYDDVMFTTDGMIHKNPALVKKVTQIVAKGFTWAHQHPVQAAQITVAGWFPAAKGTSAQANLTQQKLESQKFIPFSRDSHGVFSGRMTASYWQDSVNTLFRYGLIKSKPPVSSLFTNRFNPNTM